ncbi:cell division protein FtsW [Patescibacteria group bacterium]|nr:cell division protein FtsW [Patescibacteria group bacterium]
MKTRSFDHPLFVISVILVVLGILILAGVSAVFSQEQFGKPTYFLFHQIMYGVAPGLILGFLAFRIPLSYFKKWIFPLFLLNLVALGLVFIPIIGFQSGGATRWIGLGPFSFQPAEFLKITFLLYLAALISSRSRDSFFRQKRTDGFGSMLIIFLVLLGILTLLLALQPNIGTLAIIFLTAVLVYFSAGTPIWHSALVFSIGIGGLITLIQIAPYRFNRFLVFLNPDTDVLGIGYQIKQALIAVGSGGILGLGFGMSRQKFGFLPQSIGDSIFAIFAEEGGFIWAVILILLFLAFVWQGFQISKKSKEMFTRLAGIGISTWIGIQAFVNIASMIGILPLTGIPLPFISYGGSHLAAELIGVGILLNISRNA